MGNCCGRGKAKAYDVRSEDIDPEPYYKRPKQEPDITQPNSTFTFKTKPNRKNDDDTLDDKIRNAFMRPFGLPIPLPIIGAIFVGIF